MEDSMPAAADGAAGRAAAAAVAPMATASPRGSASAAAVEVWPRDVCRSSADAAPGPAPSFNATGAADADAGPWAAGRLPGAAGGRG